MARKPKQIITSDDIHGLKYLRAFEEILAPIQNIPAHGNRQFHMHQHVNLMLLQFFNPVLTSLRSLQQATGLENVQKALHIRKTSLSAMSESAGHVFDPELMLPIIQEIIAKLPDCRGNDWMQNLPGRPIAVDGSFLRCVPDMLWAVFRKQSEKRGARLHLQFDLQLQAPTSVEITEAMSSEKKVLKKHLKAGSLYIMDRGYVDYRLYQAIDDSDAYFAARIKDSNSYEVIEENIVSSQDAAAGVLSDQWVRMGSAFTKGHLTASVRRVKIYDKEKDTCVILLTNTDISGELLSVLYRHRWQVELFFRWFKCILGCTHWLSRSRSGLTLQVYIAILACLLIRLWTGRKPTKRTFEMICLYFQGWARESELTRHIESLNISA